MRLASGCAVVLLVSALGSVGCWLCHRTGPVTDDMAVGEYEFVSMTLRDGREGDRVVLKADNTYVPTRATRSGARAEEVGAWTLEASGDQWLVNFDKSAYAVRFTKRETQLIYDDDLGLMFMRPRKKR